MNRSRARRLQRQIRQQVQQAQLQESTTYSELLATTIPANSNQNADKVAQTLGIVQHVPSSSTSPAVDVVSDEADDGNDGNDGERASPLGSKSCLSLATSNLTADLTSGTALYHAAIKPNTNQGATKMAAQSKEVETNEKGLQQTKADDEVVESNKADGKKPEITGATIPASLNTNCAVTIWNLPNGVTEPMIIEAISQHKPIGKIYACDVYVIPGPNNVPPVMPVASVRFMRPESATRLVLIGNRPEPEQGIYVKGKRAKIVLAHRPQPAYLKEPASRIVFFRGPRNIVNPIALRKLWGFKEQTERLIIGKVEKGVCEIEWRFCSYAYNAEPAFCVFEDVYGKREDCSVWYGVDPCN